MHSKIRGGSNVFLIGELFLDEEIVETPTFVESVPFFD